MTATIATAPYLQPLVPLALATAYDPTAGECDIDAAARLLAETHPRIAWQMSDPDSPLWDNAIALAAMVEEAAAADTGPRSFSRPLCPVCNEPATIDRRNGIAIHGNIDPLTGATTSTCHHFPPTPAPACNCAICRAMADRTEPTH